MGLGPELFDRETVVSRTSGANTVVETVYRIVSQNTLDFTTIGAPDNNANTVFIATAVDTLGAGDELAEITAPDKSIPVKDPWPALAGSEAINDSDNQDFADGTINEWASSGAGAGGTCVFDNSSIGGADDKQGLLTATDDGWLLARLDASDGGASITVAANTLYKVSMKVYTPAANVSQGVVLSTYLLTGAITSSTTNTLADDTWTLVEGYIWVATDVDGYFSLSVSGSATTGDEYYFDDISIRPVQFSWVPYGTNIIDVDETEDALKITYVNAATGAYFWLRNSSDLSSDLAIGKTYLLSFESKDVNGAVKWYLEADSTNPGVYTYQTGTVTTSWAEYQILFVARHETGGFIRSFNMGATDIVYLRNLSIRPYTNGGLRNCATNLTT